MMNRNTWIALAVLTLLVALGLIRDIDYNHLDNLWFDFELDFQRFLEIIISALAASGTLWAVRTTLTYHEREKRFKDKELKDQIIKTMLYEIVMNYTSIYTGGMMEILIEDSQYKMFKSNLHIFSHRHLYIVELAPGITQLYNLFRFYEYVWRNERGAAYTYKSYEAKFKVKAYFLKLLDVLKAEDYEISETLSFILLYFNVHIDPSISVKHRPVIEYIHSEYGERYLEKGSKVTHEIIVELFEEYIDKKYNPQNLNYSLLLANLLDKQ